MDFQPDKILAPRSNLRRFLGCALGAWLLLNFSMLVLLLFSLVYDVLTWRLPRILEHLELFARLLGGFGFWAHFDLQLLPISIFMFVFSLGFWIKERSWLSAGVLVIVGTAGGLLQPYFFGFPGGAFCGCWLTLWVAWLVHFMPVFGKNWQTRFFCKSFWNWKFVSFALACALGIIFCSGQIILAPYIFLWGGKVLPYECNDFKGGSNRAEMAISMNAKNLEPADIVQTCLSALNYVKEKHGYDDIIVEVSQKPHKLGFTLPRIGQCKYNWMGEYWNGNYLEKWHYRVLAPANLLNDQENMINTHLATPPLPGESYMDLRHRVANELNLPPELVIKKEPSLKLVPEFMLSQPAATPPLTEADLPQEPSDAELYQEGLEIAREFAKLRIHPTWGACVAGAGSGPCKTTLQKFYVFDGKARRLHLKKSLSLANDLNSFLITTKDGEIERSAEFWARVMERIQP